MTNDTAPPKRRSTRVALDTERIAAAAFALIDAEGVAALSARRLAQALGCEAMSLYHHVPTMEAVLDLVVDVLLGRFAPAPGEGRPRARLIAQARDFLALAERHPQVFVMAAARRWKTPNAFALVQSAVAAFVAAGARPRQALCRARILGAYLGGAGTARAGWAIDAATAADRPLPVPPAAPRLPGGSNRAAVRRDLDQGIALLVDALLAGLPGGSGGPRA